MPRPEFYLRYYVGHRGKFGHEFMEFEFASTGKLRYANNSNYKNDSMIRKEVTVSDAVLDEIERIITDAEITKEDDADWPEPDRVGRQELEVISNGEHISFTCAKIGSLLDVRFGMGVRPCHGKTQSDERIWSCCFRLSHNPCKPLADC